MILLDLHIALAMHSNTFRLVLQRFLKLNTKEICVFVAGKKEVLTYNIKDSNFSDFASTAF